MVMVAGPVSGRRNFAILPAENEVEEGLQVPVFKQHADLVVRGLRVFLNLEAGVTRVGASGVGPGKGAGGATTGGATGSVARNGTPTRRGAVTPENIVWIFGSGRSGSTWLSSMMGDMTGQALWGEPWVGTLFGNFYYSQSEGLRNNPQFILGRHRESWIGSIRNLLLEAATVTFPNIKETDFLIIKEPNGSVGAPLLMEAVPESRMVLLVRDPRDIVASALDGRREGGWHYEKHKARLYEQGKKAPEKNSVAFAEGRASNYLQGMGNAKAAYDAHKGPKVLIRYEELNADALGTMQRLYSTLGVPVNEGELARVVEKHSWENIPEEKRGAGKFYRKATPGGWREDLTAEQAEAVERVTATLLEEFYPEKA